MFASIILVSKEYSITHYKRLPGPATEGGQPPSMAIDVTTTVTTSLDPPFWFYRKPKTSLAERYPDLRESRLHDRTLRIKKVSGFKVPTLDSGFKISGDMTKPGSFYFGFILLCVSGKTNPVLKRSGFVTNPEQFPLV